MKTAISIPDELFKGAERLARQTKRSRSQLFSDAMKEYLARHTTDNVTDEMNRVCADVGSGADEFSTSVARELLKHVEW
jgi:metal-responsive CopG/Arc/MetJ family transcriptional regulator